ncbi:T9SS type B sorting domain-containing protein [Aquimarina mytili]|uniref:T9SS type B sorting domain-containing protein n=1 Tax=Aquimarina mytili TaxID=874423 RepID=A0A936ZZ86_9FLAO|nr:T9SS type B sorting domain-containing protein [Aquimarina mytili]MBL0684698.1 T9SS type B sorting domain-containing protein [Aquimarina mytili]
MKTKIHIKIVLAMLFLIASNISNINAQVAFDTVPNSTLRINGELKIIANSIVGLNQQLSNNCFTGSGTTYSPNDDYDGPCWNNSYNDGNRRRTFGYIDVDGDASTFSSSSATLEIRAPAAAQCERIAYAGLYWAASYFGDLDSDDDAIYSGLPLPDNRPDFRTIKIRHESQAGYTTIPATQTQVIYDGYRNTATNPFDVAAIDMPYVCYADVTSILQGLADPQGEYTVADMRASIGKAPINSNGISGGWVLVVAYEDPQLSAKYISTTNGYLVIAPGDPARTFDYSNFETLPAPLPVRARYAIATLEGDQPFTGDIFQVQNTGGTQTDIFTTPANPAGNFFDSSITVDGNYVTNRNPASENTLGFDADIFDIPNPGNTVIGNNQTSAEFTTTSAGDAYSVFFSSFQIEVIEPELTVTKRVLDVNGIDITGDPVNFADQLFYELTIENQGNEAITAATIRDVLPANVDFTLGSITTSNPGITATPAAGNRQIDITINDNLVVRNGGIHTVRFGVSVVATCADLRDACSNQINNVAISTYTGVESGITKSGEESILEQDACRFDVAGSSNVLVNDGICFSESQPAFICTGSLTLTAGAGFTNYSWENTANPGVVIGTNQTLDVTVAGTYQVTKTGAAGCQDGIETFVVDAFNTVDNPLVNIVNTDLATNPNVNGSIRTCPVTGEPLPEVFLCGAGTTLDINSGFTTATAIEWQRLDPAACGSVPRDENCPTTDAACEPDWVTVGTGINFTLNQAGEYRINATFDSNCTIPFYFNAFQNNFDPDLVVVEQIICGNPGTLRVQNSSNQYEYQLILPSGGTTAFQLSAEFSGLTEVGTYSVNVRQTGGLPTACTFQDSVFLDELDANESVTPFSPLCPDDRGRIEITVTDSQINYTYTISNTAGTFTDSEGPTTLPNHTFSGLNPDTYDVQVISADGSCSEPFTVTIDPAATFTATIALVEDLHCNPNYQPNPNLNDPTHPDFDPSAPPFDPDRDIAIYEVTVTGGTGTPPSFAFNDQMDFLGTNLLPEAGTTYRFRATAAGNYPVYVSDNATNCVVFAGSVDVTDYEPIQATATPTNPTCNGELGSIVVTITAGLAEGPFTYILNGGTPGEVRIGPSNNTTETFNNVDPTVTHTVTVEDQFGCDFTVTPDITFTTPGAIVATIDEDFRLLSCTATPDAQAQITGITGGSGSYEWSLNPVGPFTAVGAIPFEIDFPSAGSFTLYVRDQAGTCVESFPITIDPLLTVDDITFSVPGNSNCSTQTFNVTATAQPVGPTYTYGVTPAPVSGNATTGVFRLQRGVSYTFTATRTDNQCSYSEIFSEGTIPEIQITSAVQTNPVTCVGDDDGAFSFTVANSTTFDYTVRGPAPSNGVIASGTSGVSTVTISSPTTPLIAGTYTIDVTDTSLTPSSANCTDSITIDITEPATPLSFTTVVDSADCGNPTGIITVNAVGGRGGYQYELRDAAGTGVIVAYQASNVFNNLGPATYTVFVRDDSDPTLACEVSQQVVMPVTGPPTLALDTGGDECYTPADPATQWITIIPSIPAPLGPFTYSLDGGAPVAVDFTTPVGLPANTFEVPNLAPGAHTVTVTNTASTCTSAAINFSINDELVVTANLTKDLTCAPTADATVEFTATGGDGAYTFDIVDVGPPSADFATGVTSPAPINTGGTYQIRVTDGEGCIALSNEFTVTPYVPVVATAVPTDPDCPGDGGSILVTVTAGDGPFTYVLDQGTPGEVSVGPVGVTTNTFTNVPVGGHTVVITDGDGCDITPIPVSITAPTAITANIAITTEYRCDASGSSAPPQFGVITVSGAANGNGSYEYSIDGVDFSNTTGIFNNLTDGTYTLFIQDTDTRACPVNLGSLTIDPLQEVTDIDFAQTQVQCPALTSDITLTATGTNGAASFEFRIAAPPANVTAFSVTNTYTLPAGTTYTFEARTTTDGCVYSEDYTIDNVDPIAVVGNVTDEPTCNGDTDAALSFNVTGIDLTTTNYTFVVTGGTIVGSITGGPINTTPTPIGGLGAGTYDIVVTDATTLCDSSTQVIINDPAVLSFTTATTTADCNAPNGTITVTASGGRGGYQYELRDSGGVVLVPYQSSNVFTGLAGGTPPTPITYIVAVRDTNDPTTACEATPQNVDLFQAPPITLALTEGGDQCYTNADPATQWVTITGGVAPYTYSLDGGAPVAVDFTTPAGLPANTFEIPNLTPRNSGSNYSVTVSDVNGCTSGVITFEIQDELIVTATRLKNLDCSATPDAQINVVVTGGNGATSLEVSFNGGAFAAYAGPIPFTTTTPGDYQFRVTDTATPPTVACTDLSDVITIDPAPNPAVSAPTVTNATCPGLADGSVTVNIDNTIGTPPYMINFNGLGFSNQITYGGLAGDAPSVDPLGREYTYIVMDAKGCTTTFSAFVFEPEPFSFTRVETDIICGVGGNVLGNVVYSAIAGGTPNYTYTLLNIDDTPATTTSPNPVGPTAATTVTFADLDFGDYKLRIVDANGCVTEDPFNIATPAIFSIAASTTGSCLDGVTASITVSGGTGPFEIREYPSGVFGAMNALPASSGTPFERNHQFLNLPFDTPFTFEVRDTATGCTDIRTLAPPPNPVGTADITGTETDVTCNGADDGTFAYTVVDYLGDELTYNVFRTTDLATDIIISEGLTFNNGNPQTVAVGGTATGIVSGFGPGEYLLRVTETGGAVATPCNSSVIFTIEEPTTLDLTLGTPTVANCNTVAQVVANGIGGVPPYEYAAVPAGDPAPNPATDYSTNNVLDLDPGPGPAFVLNWDIYVIDDRCSTPVTRPVTIIRTADPQFTVVPAFVDDACTFDNNYTFTVRATGESQLEFGIDDGDTGTADSPVFANGTQIGATNVYEFTYTVTGPSIDEYTLTVRDVNGCEDTDRMIVYPELIVDANFIAPDPTCLADDGTIEVTVTGGSDFTANPANFTFTLTGTDSSGTPIAPIVQTGAILGAAAATFTSVTAGTYTVEVRDLTIGPAAPAPGGCAVTDDVSRPVPTEPVLDPPTITDVSCNGGSDGSILVNIQAGTDTDGPFTYELWQGPTGTGTLLFTQPNDPLFDGLADISGLAPPNNVYGILVRSNNGCEDAIEDLTVPSPALLTATATASTYSCDASNNDVFPDITVDILGGNPPYRITYTGPLSGTNLAVTGAQYVIDADVAGTYVITVLDSKNCSFTIVPDTVIPDFPIMTDPTITRDITAVNNGVISCNNPETVIVSITGGTGPFDFVEISGNGTPPVPSQTGIVAGTGDNGATPEIETTATFTLPSVGSYQFRIIDQGTTCSIETPTYDIAPFDTIEAVIAPLTNVACFGDTTGEVTLTVNGYTGTYDFVATNTTTAATILGSGNTTTDPATGLVISGLGAGNIVVTVTATQTPFCDDDSNAVNLSQPAVLTLDIDSATFPDCNNPLSVVTMDANGGVGPYNFAFVAGTLPQPDPAVFPETNTFSLDPAVSLNWVIFVEDANGCITPDEITIPDVTPAPVINTIDAFVDDACTFDNDYTFTVTATSNVVIPPGAGTLTFALDGGAQVAGTATGPNTATIDFTVSGPGTYSVVAFDENGCPSLPETITVFPELLVTATITEPTCRDNDATIIATVTGGSDFAANPGNFTFDLVDAGTGTSIAGVTQTPGPGANQLTFSSTVAGTNGIFPGDYRVEVTDSAINTAPGCTATDDVTVPTFVDPIPTATPTPVSCFGGDDGTILIELDPTADDNPTYTYELFVYDPSPTATGVSVTGPQTSPLFNNTIAPIPAGQYEVVVTSGKGCTATVEPITVGGPTAALNVVPSQTPYSCDPSNDAVFPVITLTISGGTAPYDVSYTGPSSSGTETDVADADGNPANDVQYEIDAPVAGTYTITVTDNKNCVFTAFDVIVPPLAIMTDPTVTRDVTAVNGGVISCTNPETVIVSITGGTGPFDFAEISGSGTPPVPAQLGIAAGTGDDPGTPEIETIAVFTLPSVGSYVFRITDQTTTCTIDTPSYDIGQFDTIEAEITLGNDVTCFNTTPPDGSVNLTVTGYTGTYDYVATNTTTGATVLGSDNTASGTINIPGLEAGNIVVTVTATQTPFCDADSNTQAITLPAELTVTANQIREESCNPPAPGGDDALIEAVGNGGVPGAGGLEYQLETAGGIILVPFSTDPRFGDFGLDGGVAPAGIDYVVRVRDSRGCENTDTINIQPPVQIILDPIANITLDCSDSEDGVITAVASAGQGAGTYFFALTLPDGTQTAAVNNGTATFTWSDLKPGNYTVTVSDNLTCETTTTVTIDTPPAVTVDVNATGISCLTANPNNIQVIPGGGIGAPYEFGVSNNGGAITWQASDTFAGLPAGNYDFYVRDGNLCESPASNTIQVRDPEPFVVTLDLSNDFIVCFSEPTGSIDAVATGGLGNYMYSVTGTDYLGNAVNLGPQATSFFGDLLAGTYTYTTMSADCADDVQPFEIRQPAEFIIEVFEEPISCNGETDGRIRVTAVGGTAPYFYSLYNSAGDAVFTFLEDDIDNLLGEHTFENLTADIYRVEVEDFNGCPREEIDVEIIEPAPIEAIITATTPEDCAGDMNGTANISITGGLQPLPPASPEYYWSIDGVTYQLVPDPTNLFIDNLPGGTTTLFIRDSQNSANCQGAFNIDITPGVVLEAPLVQSLICPEYDYSDPENPVLTSDERYFVTFDIDSLTQTLDVIYTVEGINGTPNPANNTSLENTFEVTPGQYEGFMEFQMCRRSVGEIEVLEYTPLSTPVAQMTNNPQDPNEYEIIVDGGRQFDREPRYAYYFTRLEDGMTIDDLDPLDYTELSGNIFVIRETGDYVLRVVDAAGCETIVVQRLTYINIRIPNYFTPDSPNGDPNDRFWYPRQITPNSDDPFFFENMEVMVFDRYGRMLAEFKGDQLGWDGMYQGKQLPSGDYWYTIILNDVDNREFTGHFTLYR